MLCSQKLDKAFVHDLDAYIRPRLGWTRAILTTVIVVLDAHLSFGGTTRQRAVAAATQEKITKWKLIPVALSGSNGFESSL